MNSDKITLVSRLLAFVNGESADGVAAELSTEGGEALAGAPAVIAGTITAPVVKTTDFSAELEAEKAARVLVEGQLKDMKAASIKTQATAFATEVIAGKHAQESERATIEAAFSQALADDDSNPVEIQFSADSKGSRVDAIRNLYGSKKVVPLTEEALNEDETETLLSDDTPKPNADRLAKVRERAVALAERENKRIERLAARK